MKEYHFWKVFLRYVIYLFLLLMILFLGIIIAFSLEVNHEIEETSIKQTTSIKNAIKSNNKLDSGHYFFITDSKTITENVTPFTQKELEQYFVDKVKTSLVSKSHKGVFDVRISKISENRTLYSLTNVSDFYETKYFLTRELTIAFIFAFVLMIFMAYYLAKRPILVYQKLMEEQRLFVQNASHEMKTPVASVLLGIQYLDLVDGKHLSKDGNDILSQMRTEITYMKQLVETMLNDNIDNDKVKSIDISKIFDETIITVENVYHSTIKKRYKSPLFFTIHPRHLKQMINILLENAFHHNSEEVQVSLSVFETINGIQIEVYDNGKGISKSDQNKIFQRFYQVDNNNKGSGIGLSLLENIVSQYNGTIDVQSQLEKGTKFIIKL